MCLNLDTGNTACRTLPRTDTYIIIHIKRGPGNYFSDKREFVDGCIAGGQLISLCQNGKMRKNLREAGT